LSRNGEAQARSHEPVGFFARILTMGGLGQSNVSNHLSCLKDCGLVNSTQKGRYVYYSYTDPRIGNFLQLADSMVSDLAKGFYECTRYAEEKDEEACPS
ncbi:MAG: helix-turn-helix domain-containing protein, partial [Candidatus Obscuribacterales bacterium]|nr:helix-turn-helix domain-containing protein [Candidatus Obscuribacterales bacterium]